MTEPEGESALEKRMRALTERERAYGKQEELGWEPEWDEQKRAL